MGYPGMNRGKYTQDNQLSTVTEAESASPERLVQMLLEGALVRIMRAKGCMQRKEVAQKGENIGKVLAIVDHLKSCLDHSNGGDIADNLDNIYGYVSALLLKANLNSEPALLDEASELLSKIKEGWDILADKSTASQNTESRNTLLAGVA